MPRTSPRTGIAVNSGARKRRSTLPPYSILEAPSILGLSPTGVESLPEALLGAGLRIGLQAESSGRIVPPAYSSKRDERTLLLNGEGIKEFSLRMADRVSEVLRRDRFPVVLGGDCSILIGNLLALRRTARFGLLHIDGHADFYQPKPPGFEKKLRVAFDWTLDMIFSRDLVQFLDFRAPMISRREADPPIQPKTVAARIAGTAVQARRDRDI